SADSRTSTRSPPDIPGCFEETQVTALIVYSSPTPCRIVPGHADHELADRSRRGRSPGPPPARVVPFAGAPRGPPPTPPPMGAGGSAGTAPRATAGRPAGSGPGRSGGAAPRSRAGAP